MAKPYSLDLRERVIQSVEDGMSCHKAAALFHLGASTVIRWVGRVRDSGTVAAKPMGGDHSSKLKGERIWLLERIEAAPDLTLEELRGELKERGVMVGYGTVWRFFAAEGISFKKNRSRGRARAA